MPVFLHPLKKPLPASGHLDLEVLDETNKPITGCTSADCIYYNNVHKCMTFAGKPDLTALIGRTIRLRFNMRERKPHAFQFVGK